LNLSTPPAKGGLEACADCGEGATDYKPLQAPPAVPATIGDCLHLGALVRRLATNENLFIVAFANDPHQLSKNLLFY